MEISSPLCITSRLLPGCRIGGAELSIEYAGATSDIPIRRRQRYHWRIDLPNSGGEFEGNDLTSGVDGGTLQEGLESLLCFLGAFAVACQYDDPPEFKQPEACMFPAGLAEWAVENQDTFSDMELELSEHPGKLIVE